MRNFNWWGRIGLAGLALAAGGCALLRAPSKGTQALVHKVEGTLGFHQPTNELALVQISIMREADSYVTVLAQAANEFAAKVGTQEAQLAALHWKLHEGTAAFGIAVGENPFLNAVDFVVLATLSRQVVEGYWVGKKFGKDALPLLEVHRTLETNAWSFVSEVLTFEQRVELRDLISTWTKQHPDQRYVGAIRLRDFMAVLGSKGAQTQATKASSILKLLDFDPLSGIDPAVREVERTRLFAQRLMFYFEHFPMLLNWQVEDTTSQVAAQPAPQQVLSNLTSFAESAHVFSQVAQQLPEIANEQRKAAITQMLAGLASERSNVLATLNAQEAQFRELLPAVRQTLNAGSEMGQSLNGAIKSLDQFVHYVSPPETNQPASSTNRHPFSITEYGNAATQIAAMSKELDRLLLTADRSATQMAVLGEQVGAKADRVVDRAFRLAVVLIVVLLAGLVLALLAYRFLASRLIRAPEPPPAVGP